MASSPILPWFGRLTQLMRPWSAVGTPRPAHPGRPPGTAGRHSCMHQQWPALSGPPQPAGLGPLPRAQPGLATGPVPYAALAAACLIKLDQQLVSMGRLRQYLVDNPA